MGEDNRTQLVMVMDRSGSMASSAASSSSAINQFIIEQQKVPGKAWLTFLQFDQESMEFIHRDVKLSEVRPDFSLIARGGTPLYDAIGTAILAVEKDLADKTNPRQVIMVVITDGQENASQEFTSDQVQKMVEERTARGWSFVYLGAALNKWAARQHATQSMATGTPVASSVSHAQTAQGYAGAMASTSSAVTRSRLTGDPVQYTDEEREQAESDITD